MDFALFHRFGRQLQNGRPIGHRFDRDSGFNARNLNPVISGYLFDENECNITGFVIVIDALNGQLCDITADRRGVVP